MARYTQPVEILDILKDKFGVRSDLALAKQLGIPQGTVAKWRKRGSISVGGAARIANVLRVSLQDLLEEPPAPMMVSEARAVYGTADTDTRILIDDLVAYIKDAGRVERETVRRLVEGLQAGPEVRTHLIGQLKLIEKLVQTEKEAARGHGEEDPPIRSQAS